MYARTVSIVIIRKVNGLKHGNGRMAGIYIFLDLKKRKVFGIYSVKSERSIILGIIENNVLKGRGCVNRNMTDENINRCPHYVPELCKNKERKEFIEDLKEFNIVCKGFSVIRVQTIYDLSTEKQKKWEKKL